MPRNSAAAQARKAANLEFFSEVLEGFAVEYDIELQKFGSGIHWRLSSGFAVLDVWPTTARFYIKELPLGRGFAAEERGGTLPKDHNKLDKFLTTLLLEAKQ